jgi:alpha-beta hydrolase superfamily lysophospholipase
MGHLMTAAVESTLLAADGTELFVTDWMPQNMRGGVVLMHGIGEHSGRYAHVVEFFNLREWAVRTYDHRGHGRSGGRRGDVPGNETAFQDAAIVISDFARVLKDHGINDAPLLFGHSMGGLFAARFATARMAPLQGLILSSPALALPLSAAQKMLLAILTAVAPGLGVSTKLKTQYLSHDPAVAVAYHGDPLVHGKISARLLNCMRAAVNYAQVHAASLDIPTLLVYAGQDHLVDARGSEQFFPRLANGLGTAHCYPDFYHEIFNEADKARVFADLHAWLEKIRVRHPAASAASAAQSA